MLTYWMTEYGAFATYQNALAATAAKKDPKAPHMVTSIWEAGEDAAEVAHRASCAFEKDARVLLNYTYTLPLEESDRITRAVTESLVEKFGTEKTFRLLHVVGGPPPLDVYITKANAPRATGQRFVVKRASRPQDNFVPHTERERAVPPVEGAVLAPHAEVCPYASNDTYVWTLDVPDLDALLRLLYEVGYGISLYHSPVNTYPTLTFND